MNSRLPILLPTNIIDNVRQEHLSLPHKPVIAKSPHFGVSIDCGLTGVTYENREFGDDYNGEDLKWRVSLSKQDGDSRIEALYDATGKLTEVTELYGVNKESPTRVIVHTKGRFFEMENDGGNMVYFLLGEEVIPPAQGSYRVSSLIEYKGCKLKTNPVTASTLSEAYSEAEDEVRRKTGGEFVDSEGDRFFRTGMRIIEYRQGSGVGDYVYVPWIVEYLPNSKCHPEV